MSYEDLLHEELLHALKQMIAEAQQFTISFNAAARLNLLPALTAMKDKDSQPGRREPDPNKPNREDVCRMLGISPGLARMWIYRTQTDHDIQPLLGETFAPPQNPKRRRQKRHGRQAPRAGLPRRP